MYLLVISYEHVIQWLSFCCCISFFFGGVFFHKAGRLNYLTFVIPGMKEIKKLIQTDFMMSFPQNKTSVKSHLCFYLQFCWYLFRVCIVCVNLVTCVYCLYVLCHLCVKLLCNLLLVCNKIIMSTQEARAMTNLSIHSDIIVMKSTYWIF